MQYGPNQVKDAVAGWGGADKAQVQKMVQSRLRLSAPPTPADAADAPSDGRVVEQTLEPAALPRRRAAHGNRN